MGKSSGWFKPLARAGYFSRGLVYAIIGMFAVLAAFGAGQKKDTKGALLTILEQPFGTLLIALLIIGLVGYVGWRLVQSLFDTDDHGHSLKGLAVRAGLLSSAATYGTLAIFAVSLLLQTSLGSSGSGSVASSISGFIGAKPVTLGMAAIFAGVAAAHWWKAATRKYADHFQADDSTMTFIHPISIVGLTARGCVFAILTVILLFRSAQTRNPDAETPGLKEAMEHLQQLPYGQVLLFAMGIGLLLFSAYSFAEARWRRINIEDA